MQIQRHELCGLDCQCLPAGQTVSYLEIFAHSCIIDTMSNHSHLPGVEPIITYTAILRLSRRAASAWLSSLGSSAMINKPETILHRDRLLAIAQQQGGQSASCGGKAIHLSMTL